MLRYFCSPFYVHSALHPILDQLERAAQLKKSDPPEVKLDKLEALLSQGTSQVARAAALLAPLLSIPTGERYPVLDLAPERKKTLALEALLEQLARLAARPVLIILEDAHWIDPDLRRAVPADDRSHPAHAGPCADRVSARLQPALDRLSPRHVAVARRI